MFKNFAHEIVEADIDIDRAAADGLRAVEGGRPEIRREANRPPARHGQRLLGDVWNGRRGGRIRGEQRACAAEQKAKRDEDRAAQPA